MLLTYSQQTLSNVSDTEVMMTGLDVFRLWQTEAKGKITRLWWKQEDTATWFFLKEVYKKNIKKKW